MLLRMSVFGSWKLAPSLLSLPATWESWLPAVGMTGLGLCFWSVFHSAGSTNAFLVVLVYSGASVTFGV